MAIVEIAAAFVHASVVGLATGKVIDVMTPNAHEMGGSSGEPFGSPELVAIREDVKGRMKALGIKSCDCTPT